MTTRTASQSNSDIRLLGGVLLALIIIAVLTLLAGENGPPLSVHNSQADGAMVLSLWVQQSGFDVHEITADPIKLDSERALFILDPDTAYTAAEATYLRDWVRQGNMLVVTGEPLTVNDLLKPYSVSLDYAFSDQTVSLNAPTLITPPFDNAQIQTHYFIDSTRTDLISHASLSNNPVIVSFNEGKGQVWVLGASYPFTNRGLQDDPNAKLVLNLINNLPNGAVGFDEARHGYATSSSVSGWLFNTPPGWSILLALILTLLYLGLRGRRFGKVMSVPEERLRREPVEYIQAIANLFRRSGQRVEMLRHYRAQLRRRLAERYGVDPHLNDVETVKMIVIRDPRVDEAALRKLLAELSRQSISEAELVAAASDVDDWLRTMA